MMVPLLLAIKTGQSDHGLCMEDFYRHIGITRQGFSQARKRYNERQEAIEDILFLVSGYRQHKDRRAGSRSLYYNLDIKGRFNMGVTKFEQLLSTQGLSLRPLRIKVVTTRSSMQSWNYPNRLNGLILSDINQVVVGDLTYLYWGGKRHFLFCLKDLYSSRIVGFHRSFTMRAKDAKCVLDMWVLTRGKENLEGSIHHTDGGSQYFSKLYLSSLEDLGVAVSCARNCLQNGYAEQLNGLLKHHLIPTISLDTGDKFDKELAKIIYIYNHQRKQQGLGWLSPVEYEQKISMMSDKPKIKLYAFNESKNGF